MGQETHYGVISDFHHNSMLIPATLSILKNLGIEKIIVNGDIGDPKGTNQETQNNIASLLDCFASSGIESFFIPGSHETLATYEPVIKDYSERNNNIIDAIRNPKIEHNGHCLVFLPGSDFLCGGEYKLVEQNEVETGRYLETDDRMIKIDDIVEYTRALKNGEASRALHCTNMGDLKKMVDNPDKTILVCHVPRKFYNNLNSVDVAIYGEAQEDFYLDNNLIKKGFVFLSPVAKRFIKEGYPIEMKNENRGNDDLRSLCEELGISKAINGHFHESSHMASDSNGNSVPEDTMLYELFWNPGHLDRGKAGILTVADGKVGYKNIKLDEYM